MDLRFRPIVTLSFFIGFGIVPAHAQEAGAGQPAAAAEGESKAAAEPEKAAAPPSPEAAGDAFMAKRGLKNYKAAIAEYEDALKAKPQDLDLKLKLATSLNAVMRTKTNGNLITLDGPPDTPKNKKLWAKLGKRSEALAKEVVKARPKSLAAQMQYAEAYMYKSASFGVLTAIMQGAAGQYNDNADILIKLDKKADGGVGYIYRAGFHMVAPWPMSDSDEARRFYDLALKINSKSIRNNYYRGIRAVQDEEWALAKKHLTFAVSKPCSLASERDYCPHLKKKSKEALAIANSH